MKTANNAEDSSRELSEEENNILNGKIDQLTAALEGGARIRFDPSEETGGAEAYAEYGCHSGGEQDVEAEIASATQNFGNILHRGDRRRMIRSETSLINAGSALSVVCEDGEEVKEEDDHNEVFEVVSAVEAHGEEAELSDDWKTVPSADISSLDTPPAPLAPKGRSVHQIFRDQEKEAQEPRGHRLPLADTSDTISTWQEIWPLPLSYEKHQIPKTPSVDSGNSEFDCSSPSFMKASYAEILQVANVSTPQAQQNLETEEPVLTWLGKLEIPHPHPSKIPQPQNSVQKPREKKQTLKVFRDWGDASDSDKVVPQSNVLKDVSNLRQYGYLQYNSFAQEKGVASPYKLRNPKAQYRSARAQYEGKVRKQIQKLETDTAACDELVATPTFGGATTADQRRAFINSRWPGVLSSSVPTEQPFHPKAEQARHFEFTLARLEGHTLPQPSSPIQRYVHRGGIYGRDVEVESRRVRARQPKPVRYIQETLAERFENLLRERSQERS